MTAKDFSRKSLQGAVVGYWGRVGSRTWKETKAVWTSYRWWLAVSGPAGGIVAMGVRHGWMATMNATDTIINGFCGAVIAFGGCYLISFTRSFKLLDNDRAAEIQQKSERLNELEDRVNSATMRRAVIDQMADVFKEGQRIYNLGATGTSTAKEWAIDTQDFISQLFGAAEGEMFSNDTGFPVAIEGYPGQVWMQHRLERFHDLLSRADRLLRDYPVDLNASSDSRLNP